MNSEIFITSSTSPSLELRDGAPNRYQGKGVLKAVDNVNGLMYFPCRLREMGSVELLIRSCFQGLRVIIPIRYDDVRLPGKPLADIAGVG